MYALAFALLPHYSTMCRITLSSCTVCGFCGTEPELKTTIGQSREGRTEERNKGRTDSFEDILQNQQITRLL